MAAPTSSLFSSTKPSTDKETTMPLEAKQRRGGNISCREALKNAQHCNARSPKRHVDNDSPRAPISPPQIDLESALAKEWHSNARLDEAFELESLKYVDMNSLFERHVQKLIQTQHRLPQPGPSHSCVYFQQAVMNCMAMNYPNLSLPLLLHFLNDRACPRDAATPSRIFTISTDG